MVAGKKEVVQVNIQRGIFHGDCLSLLLSVIRLLPMPIVLRFCRAGQSLLKKSCESKSSPFLDDLKLFAKDEKEIDSLVRSVHVLNEDIGIIVLRL